MNYKIYKLKFKSPVHFGSDILGTSLEEADLICHSDTLFSALCLECISLNGKDFFEKKFFNLFYENKLLISSLFPYKKDSLYIPKPFIVKNRNNADSTEKDNKDNKYDRKAMKKISYLKIDDIKDYLESVNSNNDSFLDKINKENGYNDFAKYNLIQKVSLRSDNNKSDNSNESDNNDLYSIGAYHFNKNCGLYFIFAYNDDENLRLFESILKSLQYSGIGGKRTSGYGLFRYKAVSDNEVIKMFGFERNDKTNYKMLISLYSPAQEELNNIELNKSYYSLIKRNGFVYSHTYNDNPLKRKSICMFKEGSCFCFKDKSSIVGNIVNVSFEDDNNKRHAVYRYGKALYIDINK